MELLNLIFLVYIFWIVEWKMSILQHFLLTAWILHIHRLKLTRIYF
jgi:hypothetical protein